MTKTFSVNSNNDLYLDANNNIAMVTDLIAVLQACEHAAKTKLGEMVLQTDQGIPYFQVVFVGTPNIPQFEESLRQAFLSVAGVTQVTSLTIQQSGDLLTYTAIIQTVYGSGTIPGALGSTALSFPQRQTNLVDADYQYINSTGVIVPDTSTILADVQQEYQDVFGADMQTSPNTPQGVLITTEALARAAVVANNAQLANQINPNEAGGVFLDAIWALTGGQRTPNQYTTVAANLTGVPGTTIPSGSLAQDSITNYQFALTADITLNGIGNGSGIFQCTTAGPITVSPGNLTIIVTGGPLGWETVNNPSAQITLGSVEESDEQARNVRRETLALQSDSLSEAIISAVRIVPGVTSKPAFRENKESTTQVIDGITMVPHSIYVCVQGGLDTDIANALNSKKSGGCNYNGIVTVNVTDPFSGQVIPVKFDRPTPVPIAARVTVIPDQATQDPTNAVKNAITDYATGNLSQEPGLIIGQSVSPWEFAGAINREYPGIFILNVEISLLVPLDYSNDIIPIAINQIATISAGDIAVIIAG